MRKTMDVLLREHKTNIAMYNQLLMELETLDNETIEMLAIPAVVLSDIPKSVTNKINDPTSIVSSMYAEHTKEITRELLHLGQEIDMVENALKSLRKKQLFLIKAKYFESLSWNETRLEFCKQFPNITVRFDGKIESSHDVYVTTKSLMYQFYAAKKRISKILRS